MAMADELRKISVDNEFKVIEGKKKEQEKKEKEFNDQLEKIYRDIINRANYQAEDGNRKAGITIGKSGDISRRLENALRERLREQDGFIVCFSEYKKQYSEYAYIFLEIEW